MTTIMKVTTSILVAATILLAALTAAHAGAVLKFEQRALDPTAKSGKGIFYLEGEHARVDFENENTYEVLIYNGEDEKNPLLWLIDQNAFTYIEIRKKEVGKLQGKIRDQLEFMEAQLQQLPQTQRDMMKKQFRTQIKAMNEIVEPRDKSKLSYEKSKSEKVNEWKCAAYKCYFDGELEEEAWIAGWSEIGLKREDVTVVSDMVEAFGALTGMVFIADLWSEGSKSGIEGFPVRTVTYAGGTEMDEMTIVSVEKKDIDPKIFDLPDGLDEKSFFDQ